MSTVKGGTAAKPDAEKDNSTTPQSSHHESHSEVPNDATVQENVGSVGESGEKAEPSATAFKNHIDESSTSIKHENNGSTTTSEKLTKPTGEVETGADGEELDNTVYPKGLPLALLTLGLW